VISGDGVQNTVDLQQLIISECPRYFFLFFVIGLHGTVMSPSTVTRLARLWRKKLEKMKRKEKTALSNIQAEMVM